MIWACPPDASHASLPPAFSGAAPCPGSGAFQPRRPIPELSRINAIRFDGKSIYHGLTVKAERRLRNNYAYRISYTLSHSKDDASSPGATESETNVPQNVRNIFDDSGEWARSSFDHRHQFIASGVYQLAGWRANAVLTMLSGAPFTVTSTYPTGRSAIRTSAGSSVRRIHAKCRSACGWRSSSQLRCARSPRNNAYAGLSCSRWWW